MRSIAVLGSFALLAACARPAPIGVDKPLATATLRSAMVVSGVVTMSCRGGGFCRESAFAIEDTMALDDAKDDCTSRKGLVGSDPCPRDHFLVSCSGGGMTVLAYEQDDKTEQAEAVSKLTSICEIHEGTLERPDGR